MKKLILLAVVLMAAVSQKASATFYGTSHTYYVKLHFTAEAWGQQVLGIFSHTGVLETYSSGGSPESKLWGDVQNAAMSLSADGNYHGTAILRSGSGGGDGTFHRTLGPIVQYWLRLEDGSAQITQEALIPIQKTFCTTGMTDEERKEMDLEIQAFIENNENAQTMAIEVKGGYCS